MAWVNSSGFGALCARWDDRFDDVHCREIGLA
jgi:hypothetical protein